jgi:hypothetical protein
LGDVASVSEACCQRLFCFIYFQTYVTSVLIWMLHMFSHICYNSMLQNVSSVSVFCCSKCFHVATCKCSIRMLHMFSHIYCKCMFPMFHLFLMYVASVLSGCCMCWSGYTYMLQMYVLIVSPCFSMLQ